MLTFERQLHHLTDLRATILSSASSANPAIHTSPLSLLRNVRCEASRIAVIDPLALQSKNPGSDAAAFLSSNAARTGMKKYAIR